MDKVIKEKLLKAAKESYETKAVLKKEFPEVFNYFDLSKLKLLDYVDEGKIFTHLSSKEAGFDGGNFFQIRTNGKFAYEGFFLEDEIYDWKIVRDDVGVLVLLPITKAKEKEDMCIWSLNSLDWNTWDTGCGEKFQLDNGTPSSNSMKYCCYCGKEVKDKVII